MGTSPSKIAATPQHHQQQHWRGLSPTFTSLLRGVSSTASSASSTMYCDAPPAPPPLPSAPGGSSSGSSSSNSESLPPPPPDNIEEAAQTVTDIPNPGPYEQASMDAKRLVTLDTHDGMRFDINKQLSLYMAVVHSFWLGTSMIPDGRNKTYTFLTQVADEDSLMMARVDFDRGSVDGRVHKAILGGLAMGKVQMSLSQEGQQDQCLAELDFGGATWTSNLKYGTMGGGIVYGCNFYQAITPRFHMGGEGMYIGANQNLMSNFTAKYTMDAKSGDEDDVVKTVEPLKPQQGPPGMPTPDSTATSTIVANLNMTQQLLTLNYKRVVTPNRVTLGAELQCNPLSLDSNVLFGAEFKLAKSKVHIVVDGGGKVQSTVEAKLGQQQGVPTLSFAAEMDHPKNVMRFGFGLNVDS